MQGIYKITCLSTGKYYIGSAVNFRKRQSAHRSQLSRGVHNNSKLQAAWNKHSADTFTFEILEEVQNPADLIGREQFYMDTLRPAFNISPTAGSLLGTRHSDECRKKMSIARTGKRLSDEHRARLSEIKKASPPMPLDVRQKISKAHAGKRLSEETRTKISTTMSVLRKKSGAMTEKQKGVLRTANIGRKMSPEVCQKISAAKKGIPWSAARWAAHEARVQAK